MADETVEVVRWQMSASHPAADLCDCFAKSNRYGLGPGLYPKALAPKPPAHPWCRCHLVPILFAPSANARFDPAADAACLRTLDPKTAARVAGSRAKREAILKGENAEDLWNAKRPEAYKIGRVGDAILRPMSDEQRQAMRDARAALTNAREADRWGMKNLNRNKKETAKNLAALEQHQHVPEVANFLRRVHQDLSRVDRRELHYMERRYRDGRQIDGMAEFNELFSRVMHDPSALVYRRHGVRYQIRSKKTGWISIIDPDGTRVSLYPDLNDEFGEPLWTLKDLIP